MRGAIRRFAEWFWRPSWDANLPEGPQTRYLARKEHNRLVRRRIGLIVLVLIIIGIIARVTAGSSPPLSAACRSAVQAQNAYVTYAEGLGYPNVGFTQAAQIMTQDLDLLANVTSECPASTTVDTLPSS
jgi:hypothetical protein